MSEVTGTSSPNLTSPKTSYLRKQDNLNQQLRRVNHVLNSNISISLLNLISQNKLKKNYKEILKKQKNLIFNAKELPKISLGDFIYRITYYLKMDDASLISALIILDRFCKKQKIILTEFNIHRLLFVSVLIAIKSYEDKYFTNTFYAKICGIKTSVLNKLEYEFICSLDFQIYLDKNVYKKYQDLLLNSQD